MSDSQNILPYRMILDVICRPQFIVAGHARLARASSIIRARSAGDFRITCPVKTGVRPEHHLPFYTILVLLHAHTKYQLASQAPAGPHKHLQRCL